MEEKREEAYSGGPEMRYAEYEAMMDLRETCPVCGYEGRGEYYDGVLLCPECGHREGVSLKEVWCPANCGEGTVVWEDGMFRCTACGAAVRVRCEGVEPWPDKKGEPFVSDFQLRQVTAAEVLPGIRKLHFPLQEFTALERVVLPEGLEEIEFGAFALCISLREINIPKSVRKIGGKAFYGCAFSRIDLPEGITQIEEHTFCGCEKLNSIAIPAGVTRIGELAFQYCTALEKVVIPDGVTEIGSYAFFGCTGLRRISIPRSVISIGENAFGECPNLTVEYAEK